MTDKWEPKLGETIIWQPGIATITTDGHKVAFQRRMTTEILTYIGNNALMLRDEDGNVSQHFLTNLRNLLQDGKIAYMAGQDIVKGEQ